MWIEHNFFMIKKIETHHRSMRPESCFSFIKKLGLMLMLIGGTYALFAQDIHFSQFYNSPLTLNPALTGRMDGNYRIGAIYRNQWFQTSATGTPFVTYAAFADGAKQIKNDVLGFGVFLYQDRAGEGAINTVNVMASAAYHKSLGKSGKHALTLGTQLGMYQKKTDAEQLRFLNQYDGTVFNANLPTGENFTTGSKLLFDFNIGIFWNSRVGKSDIFAGGSIFHITEPQQNFLPDAAFNVNRRFVAHGGASVFLAEKWRLLPSVIFMQQLKAVEINPGVSFAFEFSKGYVWMLGGYYRIADGPIAYTGFDIKNFRIGLSYDVITSDLSQTGNRPGSIEISLMYVGRTLGAPAMMLFCPRL